MTRKERLDELLEEYGCADACEIREAKLGRFVVMEADEGAADNGGPWWDTGDNWRFLLDTVAGQEYPNDWPAETLFDLDTEDEWPVYQTVAYEPEGSPPEPEGDKVATDGSQTVSKEA